jgi:hypothetical protein
VGRNGPSLCGIEHLYNGLSETTKILDIWSQINKIRVFENNEHFEFLKKKGDPQLFSAGWAGLSSEWCGLQCIYYALSKNIQNYWYMMKNKKVIVFLESGIFFFPANLGKWRIWRSCARPRWVGSARSISKDDSRQYPFQRALVCSSVSNNNETTACWKLRNPANSTNPRQN